MAMQRCAACVCVCVCVCVSYAVLRMQEPQQRYGANELRIATHHLKVSAVIRQNCAPSLVVTKSF